MGVYAVCIRGHLKVTTETTSAVVLLTTPQAPYGLNTPQAPYGLNTWNHLGTKVSCYPPLGPKVFLMQMFPG